MLAVNRGRTISKSLKRQPSENAISVLVLSRAERIRAAFYIGSEAEHGLQPCLRLR